MALITTGLNNGGATTHYRFQYDDSLSGPGNPEPARTNAMIAACENDFNLMAGWFGNIALTVSTPITVNVMPGGYASAGWGPPITLTPGNASNAIVCRYLLVSEVTEMFMLAQNSGWFAPDGSNEGSAGEGLSRFLASQFLVSIGQPPAMPGFGLANSWMNSPRQDFVNHIDAGDHGIDAKTGCSILFIYYLFTQLGFTVNQIVAAAASELSGVYANLTGDNSDPFPFFKQLLDTAYPGTTTIGGANSDNPFPLGILSFWVDKSTFGRDEVTDVINSASNGTFPNAYWLMLEGFNRNKFNSLGVVGPTFSGAFANLPGITLAADPSGVSFESSNLNVPQRIRFPFDIRFTNATLGAFPAPGAAPLSEPLNAVINVGGNPLPGASAIAEFELISGADPYYTNIDATQNNVFWLSQDLRVFTASPSLNNTPVPGAPAFSSDSFSGAYSYIQSVLAFLNNPGNHFTDGTNDPFASGVIPNQAGSLTADSSVSRYTITGFFPTQFHNNYNFAIARVRLRGTSGPVGQAQNVKVFFRLWSTQTADTGFDASSTYLSHQDGGKPHWPLPAPDSHTIPFFATDNNPNLSDPNNPEYGTNGVNNSTITIATGDNAWAYFGCFLNVYDPANVVNGQPVQALLAGTHHCLAAEIAYDDAPIINANGIVANPENSDKLAQRNLQLTFADNPGPADTHRIPQTFDLRPGPTVISMAGALLDYPDELMIDWGHTPVGSIGHIYWPQVNANSVLNLANRLYGAHLLSASDGNTIDCQVARGVSYVPIPPGSTENIAGLLTVDLPQTISVGQEFNIVVRRVSTRRFRQQPVLGVRNPAVQTLVETNEGRKTEAGKIEEHKEPRIIPPMRNWRYVTGTFQVKIPVTTPQVMLRPDEDALAVMKWRLQLMTPSNRWYPVLKRYIEYLSARIAGLGGDPAAIPAGPNGAPITGVVQDLIVFTGKVIEIIYDCNGRLEAFVLNDCGKVHTFKTLNSEIGEIALRACRNHLLLSVFVEREQPQHIRKLVIKC